MNSVYLLILIVVIVVAFIVLIDNRIVGGETIRSAYAKVIDDFCENTKDEWKNCDTVVLNNIEFETGSESEHITKLMMELDYPENIQKINPSATLDVAKMKGDRDKIAFLVGFYNVVKPYKYYYNKSDDPKAGTFIHEKEYDDIFKKNIKLNSAVNTNLDGERILIWSKGSGKLNLNKAAKLINDAYDYIVLEAAGGSGLVDMYKKYGFKELLSDYKTTFPDIPDLGWMDTANMILYATPRDVIDHTQ